MKMRGADPALGSLRLRSELRRARLVVHGSRIGGVGLRAEGSTARGRFSLVAAAAHAGDAEVAATLDRVRELTEARVAARVPSIVDERLSVVGRREPVTVRPGTSLAECLAAIRRSGTGDSVFVVDDAGRLAGVLTERDIFARLAGEDVAAIDLAQPVETLMTTKPHHLHLDETVRAAIELMQTGRYRNVPLLDDDDVLQGVVRPQDILRYLAEAFPKELLNLPPRPHQLMDRPEGG
jgi:CBS domain-containing protein